jgi:hypothetical protein
MQTYIVPIIKEMPSFAELEKEFGKGNVSNIFDGRTWEFHPSSQNFTPTETQEMVLKHFDREITSGEAIAEMNKEGYLPATHFEAYEFAKANLELQRQFWIVALGSSTMGGDHRCVAVLRGGSDGRILGNGWFDREWSSGDRFLFVKNSLTKLEPFSLLTLPILIRACEAFVNVLKSEK